MNYHMTHLEEEVKNVYFQLGIFTPQDINIQFIADSLDIWIHYHDGESKAAKYNGNYYILLNDQLSPQEKWMDFGHELGHVIKHVGNQHKLKRMFRELQESQANNFMYHFCVPSFMLLNYKISNFLDIKAGIPFVVQNFNVNEIFAEERLKRFKNQLLQAKSDAEHRAFMEALYPKAPPYSDETNDVLKRLNMLLEKKGVKS
jgi:Zn-dependent peptidase ImmA (M78 family)